jgi:hypothetical protein
MNTKTVYVDWVCIVTSIGIIAGCGVDLWRVGHVSGAKMARGRRPPPVVGRRKVHGTRHRKDRATTRVKTKLKPAGVETLRPLKTPVVQKRCRSLPSDRARRRPENPMLPVASQDRDNPSQLPGDKVIVRATKSWHRHDRAGAHFRPGFVFDLSDMVGELDHTVRLMATVRATTRNLFPASTDARHSVLEEANIRPLSDPVAPVSHRIHRKAVSDASDVSDVSDVSDASDASDASDVSNKPMHDSPVCNDRLQPTPPLVTDPPCVNPEESVVDRIHRSTSRRVWMKPAPVPVTLNSPAQVRTFQQRWEGLRNIVMNSNRNSAPGMLPVVLMVSTIVLFRLEIVVWAAVDLSSSCGPDLAIVSGWSLLYVVVVFLVTLPRANLKNLDPQGSSWSLYKTCQATGVGGVVFLVAALVHTSAARYTYRLSLAWWMTLVLTSVKLILTVTCGPVLGLKTRRLVMVAWNMRNLVMSETNSRGSRAHPTPRASHEAGRDGKRAIPTPATSVHSATTPSVSPLNQRETPVGRVASETVHSATTRSVSTLDQQAIPVVRLASESVSRCLHMPLPAIVRPHPTRPPGPLLALSRGPTVTPLEASLLVDGPDGAAPALPPSVSLGNYKFSPISTDLGSRSPTTLGVPRSPSITRVRRKSRQKYDARKARRQVWFTWTPKSCHAFIRSLQDSKVLQTCLSLSVTVSILSTTLLFQLLHDVLIVVGLATSEPEMLCLSTSPVALSDLLVSLPVLVHMLVLSQMWIRNPKAQS